MKRRVLTLFAVGVVLVALTGCSASASSPTPTTPSPSARIDLPPHPTAYFFGDSWTQGYSAAKGKGYAFVAGAALGWKVVLGPDGSGTGYVHVNKTGAPTYPERAASLPAHVQADVVVLQGGINDIPGDLSQLDAAARKTVATLRERTGGAPIIILGPAPAAVPIPYELYEIDAQLAADAHQLHVPYISPIRGKWITAANVGRVIDRSTGHPDTAGHAYFGQRVAAAIRPLIQQSGSAK